MNYFVIKIDGVKTIVPGNLKNRKKYSDCIIFTGKFKECMKLV